MALIKDRDIPLGDYYGRLQIEYICYKFREKVYVRKEDKKKFQDISKGKRNKIESISNKNNGLPSIFNDEGIRKWALEKFFNEWGLPNYQYRDDYQKNIGKGKWDKLYYFKKGTELKIKVGDKVKIGVSQYVHLDDQKVEVLSEGLTIQCSFYCCSRVLTENFIKSLFE